MVSSRLLVASCALAVVVGMPLGFASAEASSTLIKARRDHVTMDLATSLSVKVLRNDQVRRKSRARVKVLRHTPGISATVKGRRIVVALGHEVTGPQTVSYRVTDVFGRRSKSRIVVTVRPTTTPVSPTASPTPTVSVSPTSAPTSGPSPTPTPAMTPTVGPTSTPSETSPTATVDPAPTDTTTPTATVDPAPTDTTTPTATVDPAPTDTTTPTVTVDPAPTDTTTPTATVDPAPTETTTTAAPDPTLLSAMVASLPVAEEQRSGYDRALFPHWISQGGGCDTRKRVLIAESLTPVTVAPSTCALSGGSWYSYYDGIITTDASSFDIDHLVPLAEAWDSGAYAWDTVTRRAFANDLGDTQALVAVTASSNRQKGDQDPGEWQPLLERCRYLSEWVAVKIRWNLTVDPAEKNALTLGAQSPACANTHVTVYPR